MANNDFQPFQDLFGDAAIDVYQGTLTAVYAASTVDAANTATSSATLEATGSNDELAACFDLSDECHVAHYVLKVATTLGANVSAQAGQTIATQDELRRTAGPAYVLRPPRARPLQPGRLSLRAIALLLAQAGDNPDFL